MTASELSANPASAPHSGYCTVRSQTCQLCFPFLTSTNEYSNPTRLHIYRSEHARITIAVIAAHQTSSRVEAHDLGPRLGRLHIALRLCRRPPPECLVQRRERCDKVGLQTCLLECTPVYLQRREASDRKKRLTYSPSARPIISSAYLQDLVRIDRQTDTQTGRDRTRHATDTDLDRAAITKHSTYCINAPLLPRGRRMPSASCLECCPPPLPGIVCEHCI